MILKNDCSDRSQEISEEKAVAAFNHAVKLFPSYRAYLKKTGFKNVPINDINAFKKYVPSLNKEWLSKNSYLAEVLKNFTIDEPPTFLISSGSSGVFSFGIHSRRQAVQQAQFLNIFLHNYFNIFTERTLIINCLAQGVHLPPVSAAITDIGPRTEALLYLLKTFSPNFAQTLVVGDNYFIKNSLEQGLNDGLDYSKMRLHLILGGVYLPEALRDHLYKLINPKKNSGTHSVFSSMGISEFGLNLFFESHETIRWRQELEANSGLIETTLNNYPQYTPMVFNYFPDSIYIEEVNQQLIITNLEEESPLPLIRYESQDKVKIIPRESELNSSKSSLVLMYGKDDSVNFRGKKIYPQQIQQGLYENFRTASTVTGLFRLNKAKNSLTLEIQLKKGVKSNKTLICQFQQASISHIDVDIPVEIFAYGDFPCGMELDYQRKFKYS